MPCPILLILSYLTVILEAYSFLKKKKGGVNLGEREIWGVAREEWRERKMWLGGEKNVVGMYYMREESILNLKS